jgi:DNA-directed RNA polymerase specialized sigma24 family protein
MEAWLLGTLRFKCAMYWKRQRADRLQAMDPLALQDLCEPDLPAQERNEVLLDLRRLTRGLGQRHRAVLWLRYGLGMSTSEVARCLGYCPASVRKLTSRARVKLGRWTVSDPAGDPSG